MNCKRLFVLLSAAAFCCLSARACETPVYRFALYSRQWLPWEYRVYYLHDGQSEASAQTTAINERLRELMRTEPLRTNVYFRAVNMGDAEQAKALPPDAMQAWERAADKTTGLHVVLAPPCRHRPRWTELFAGRLGEPTIASLIDSPARRQMAESLAQGRLPLILLEGASDEANEAAAAAIEQTSRDSAEGKIRRRGGIGDLVPPAESPPLDDGDAKASEPPRQRPNGGQPVESDVVDVHVDLIRVRRDDPLENHFVQMLMLVEEDLAPLAEQPMVFAAYGRGRVGEPFVGKGITPENLAAELIFLDRACSCEVKDQNPGMDLLTTADWDAAAEAMAERFGDEEGQEKSLSIGELVPSLSSGPPPAGGGGEAVSSQQASRAEPMDAPQPEQREVASDGEASKSATEDDSSRESGSASIDQRIVDETAPRPGRSAISPSAKEDDLSGGMAWTIGIGAIVAAVVLIAVSVLYLRSGGK